MKKKCPFCSKSVDPRGYQTHVNSHKKPAQRITDKLEPVSLEYRQGYRDGMEDSRKAA